MGAMPLHLTKVAFGSSSLEELAEHFERRAEAGGAVVLTTRYLPKRHAEIVDGGSLFWILKHQLVARSPIVAFGEVEGGRTGITLGPRLIRVVPRPRRAHQGWRYLEDADAPADLDGGTVDDIAAMPPALIGDLSAIGLL